MCRSHAHPAPELATDGDWLEAPFWIWTDHDPRRRRVFARQRGDELLLTDREGLEIPLALCAECDADRAIEQFAALAPRGIHLRSRALLTTLAARLLFGDVFLHGIGGAKYDRLTDAIIERFFGLEAPVYMVVSGTLHLPIARPAVSGDDLRGAERALREMTFHPERFLDGAAGAGSGSVGAGSSAATRDSGRSIVRRPLRERRGGDVDRAKAALDRRPLRAERSPRADPCDPTGE